METWEDTLGSRAESFGLKLPEPLSAQLSLVRRLVNRLWMYVDVGEDVGRGR